MRLFRQFFSHSVESKILALYSFSLLSFSLLALIVSYFIMIFQVRGLDISKSG